MSHTFCFLVGASASGRKALYKRWGIEVWSLVDRSDMKNVQRDSKRNDVAQVVRHDGMTGSLVP